MSKKKNDKELEALFKARDELVAEGELVRVEEIDPDDETEPAERSHAERTST